MRSVLTAILIITSLTGYCQVKKKKPINKSSSFYPSMSFTGTGSSNIYRTYTSGDTTIQEIYVGHQKSSYYFQPIDSTSVEITLEKPSSIKGLIFADEKNNLKYYPADSLRVKTKTTWSWQKIKKVYKVNDAIVKTTQPQFVKMFGSGMGFTLSRYNEVDEKAEFYFKNKRIYPIQVFSNFNKW